MSMNQGEKDLRYEVAQAENELNESESSLFHYIAIQDPTPEEETQMIAVEKEVEKARAKFRRAEDALTKFLNGRDIEEKVA